MQLKRLQAQHQKSLEYDQILRGGGSETVLVDLGGHTQVSGPQAQENSIETVCQGIQDEEARQH